MTTSQTARRMNWLTTGPSCRPSYVWHFEPIAVSTGAPGIKMIGSLARSSAPLWEWPSWLRSWRTWQAAIAMLVKMALLCAKAAAVRREMAAATRANAAAMARERPRDWILSTPRHNPPFWAFPLRFWS